MDDHGTEGAKLNTYSVALLILFPLRQLLIPPLNSLAKSTPYAKRSRPLTALSRPPNLLRLPPHAKQSLLANSCRDLSAADGRKESPRLKVVDTSIRATLAPS